MATSPQLKLLSAEEVGTIYEKCLNILSSKGVKVSHLQALKILDKAGAWVNFDDQQVRFPRDVVEMALQTTPHHMTIAGSDERNDMILPHPSGSFYGCTCNQPMRYHDPDSNTYRDMTLAKVAEWAQLIEALDEIHMGGILTPTDVPEETADIHALKVLFENTSKPLMMLSYSLESVEYLFELMLAKAGSAEALRKRPMLGMSPTPLTPLTFKAMDMEEIIQACRYGVPIMANSLPISGGTAPITIAGTVLLASIETLAVLVMSQLIEPGIPIIGKPNTSALDMLTGRALMGSVETSLCNAAASQFIKDVFHIPVQSPGFKTDSYLPDEQAMTERTLMALLVALAGTDILFMAGRMGGGSIVSFVQLILDNTLVSIIKRVRSGVKVDDDTLAWKEILDTAPGGHFIERRHTLQHCREALRPELFVLPAMEIWESEGGKDLYTRAVDKYRELKKELHPQPLPDDVQREMNLIVKRADEHLAK